MDRQAAVSTTCPYCGVGCGVHARRDGQGAWQIAGDPEHPANFGRLCSKGAALGETLRLDGRLLHPEIDGRRVSWDAALDTVAAGFKRIIDEHGPEAVAFYVSGQLLTEDYYVANKLMKGFIGSANIDTNSRLCMSSAVAAYQRAFGSDSVPCSYEDLELADLIVLVGSNLAWCHPVLFQRIQKAKAERPAMKLVVIDPRRTATCESADMHLALQPGSDVLLFNGLLNFLRREDVLDFEFLERHTEGLAAALAAARACAPSIPAVAKGCGLTEDAVARFYRLFAQTARTVTAYSQGVNQSSSGTDKGNSIINCHLATGRIGRPGMGPFSITGQPNAMGGREVGGLANQLAAHMDFDPVSVERVARFWGAPAPASAPGLKAVDMFKAVASGRIKAIWIMATNPVVSMPEAERVRAALARCDFVVVSDCIRHTDTTPYAHVLLPAAAWGEKDGTVTNSERRISRQRAFRALPGEAQPDWWIITDVARRMGFAQAFPYEHAADVFREHARLSAFENDGARDFDLGAFADIAPDDYDALCPVQWPVPAHQREGYPRLFADGRFYTPSAKARFVALTPRAPGMAPETDFPLVLNTGRVRDHWHTMTRTALSARLSAHVPEPIVQIHPADAQSCGVAHGALARVASRWGAVVVRAVVTTDQQPGQVFVPIHWNAQFASAGRVDAVVNAVTDPVSGQPEFKHTPVRVAPVAASWYGVAFARDALTMDTDYWVKVTERDAWRWELAGERAPASWSTWLRERVGETGEWLEFADARAGSFRTALVRDGRVHACLFVARAPVDIDRVWLAERFALDSIAPRDRLSLLAGRAPGAAADRGPTVCACFSIGRASLVDAIKSQGLNSVEAIGAALKAGTNCGSCVPELRSLIAECGR